MWPFSKRQEGALIKQPGAILDKDDERDFVATADIDDLPKSASLKSFCPPVKSQGSANSCTAHAVVTCFEIEARVNKNVVSEGSEQYNYYYSRLQGGIYPADKGAYLRDAVKVLQKLGNCPEKLMPYNTGRINDAPGQFCDSFAKFFKVSQYSRIIDLDVIKLNIANKHPVALSIPLYTGFYNVPAYEPIVPLPRAGDRLTGYHAVTIVGFDDTKAAFEIMNSWDGSWGAAGFAWLPYSYLKTQTHDAWVLRL